MRGFACQRCRHPVLDSWQQFTERVELRSIDGKRRAFVATTAHICKSCLPERIAEIRGAGEEEPSDNLSEGHSGSLIGSAPGSDPIADNFRRFSPEVTDNAPEPITGASGAPPKERIPPPPEWEQVKQELMRG